MSFEAIKTENTDGVFTITLSRPEALNAITTWIKTHGAPYRAAWQLHKNYQADLLDHRRAPAAARA